MTKLHFTAAPDAAEALAEMRARHDDAGAQDAQVIIALGGDGFMLGQLPPKHAYVSATFTVTLAHPGAVVRLQRPAWEVQEGAESTDTVTTQLSAAVDSLAKLLRIPAFR